VALAGKKEIDKKLTGKKIKSTLYHFDWKLPPIWRHFPVG
jgi:hypothetical protein